MIAFDVPALLALAQILAIDLLLAGDNAVAVGLAAAGLPEHQRRKAILIGLGVAVVARILFAIAAVHLLRVPGLLLAGGLLLAWVCWTIWRDLRADAAEEGPLNASSTKSFSAAVWQIIVADVSMSLDNVLAVAGAARDHPSLLAIGLLLSIALMGLAASAIARMLDRYKWIGWIGLIIVVIVAARMIWDGAWQVHALLA